MNANYTRIENTLIDNNLLSASKGKVLIIFDKEMYSFGEEEEKKYPSSSIRAYVDKLYNYYPQKQAVKDLERIFISCECEWNYSSTATAILNEKETYHMYAGDSDYVILRNERVISYGGHSRGGFVEIYVPNL